MKTERNARRDERPGDTIPEQAHVYVPPRPLASVSDHRTMDVRAIRLAAEVDPRQALTELRLEAPLRRRVAKDWVAPLAFAVLAIGFIALWWATPGLPLGNTTDSAPPPVAAPSPPPVTPHAAPPAAEAAPLGQPTTPATDVAADAPAGLAPDPVLAPAGGAHSAVSPKASVPGAAVSSGAEPPPAPNTSAPRRPKAPRNPWLE